jgi:hypothetical protein
MGLTVGCFPSPSARARVDGCWDYSAVRSEVLAVEFSLAFETRLRSGG